MENETINVVLCTDGNYAMPTAVLVCSLCEHTRAHIVFHLFTNLLADAWQVRNISAVAGRYDATLKVYTVSAQTMDFVPVGRDYQPSRISVAAYYRLLVAQLLPDNVSKALYIDSDIVCNSSIVSLWHTDIDGFPLAAVEDVFVGKKEHLKGRTELFGNGRYFNSGVLLVNVGYWREHKVYDTFKDIVNKYYDRLSFHDQDVLNLAFIDSYKPLDRRFNVYDVFFHSVQEHTSVDSRQLEDLRNNPVLVHFCSDMKPWIKGFRHPYVKAFLEYKTRTPWRHSWLSLKKACTFKQHIINALVRLNLHQYNGDYITLAK